MGNIQKEKRLVKAFHDLFSESDINVSHFYDTAYKTYVKPELIRESVLFEFCENLKDATEINLIKSQISKLQKQLEKLQDKQKKVNPQPRITNIIGDGCSRGRVPARSIC